MKKAASFSITVLLFVAAVSMAAAYFVLPGLLKKKIVPKV